MGSLGTSKKGSRWTHGQGVVLDFDCTLESFGEYIFILGFSGGSEGKASACKAGDLGLIPGSGRSPGEGNGNPLQYPCLENPMDREA